MKKLLLSIFAYAVIFASYAATINVNEFGTGGAYSSISAAITAANEGDIILVVPKSGNTAYVGDLNINKALSIVSSNASTIYISGNITIAPTLAGSKIFLKQINLSGTVTAGTMPTGDHSTVSISNMTSGTVNLNEDNLVTNLYNSAFGSVLITAGNIVGSHGATIRVDETNPVATYTGDTNIVGNRSNGNYTYTNGTNHTVKMVVIENASRTVNFYNNHVYVTATDLSGGDLITHGVYLDNNGTVNFTNNTLYVNTIATSFIEDEIGVERVGSTVLNGFNNYFRIDSGDSNRGGGSISYSQSLSGSFSGSGGNNITARDYFVSSGGTAISGGINEGHPNSMFYNINETVNNIGAYGGSFTRSQTNNDDLSKVVLIDMPRYISDVNTLVNVISSANVIGAEYYWDTDPGEGNAINTNINATDGAFDTVVEDITISNLQFPGTTGVHTFNFRVNDNIHGWSAPFTVVVELGTTLSTEDFTPSEKTSLYPNPASSFATIKMNNAFVGSVQVELYDITGKMIYENLEEKSALNFQSNINVSQFNEGIYMLKIQAGDSSTAKKLIITK